MMTSHNKPLALYPWILCVFNTVAMHMMCVTVTLPTRCWSHWRTLQHLLSAERAWAILWIINDIGDV